MSNFWLDIINVICASILILLSFVDNITKKSFSNRSKYFLRLLEYLKKVLVKLIIVIIVGLTSIWVTYKKNQNSGKEKFEAEKKFKSELNSRDSNDQVNFNRSLSKSSAASSSASAEIMAKYYLKYDSAQHKIEKIIQDTNNRKVTEKIITNTSDAKPEFDISNIQFIKSRNDTLEFKFTLECKKTAIENLNLKIQVILKKAGVYSFCPQTIGFMPSDVYMSSNTSKVADNININSLKNIYEAYFHIFGYYYFNKEKYPIDFIEYYNFRNKDFGIPGTKVYLANLFSEEP